MDALRRKMDKKVRPKMLKGQLVSGAQLVELAEAYTDALNKGGIPVIESAWQYMQSAQLEEAYKKTIIEFEAKIEKEVIPNLPAMENNIKLKCKALKEEGMAFFKQNTIGDMSSSKNQKYLEKLNKDFKDKKTDLVKRNIETTQR
jgi:hypothetical protein